VARQTATYNAVGADLIHGMSGVSMAQSTKSDMLKDHMARMFVHGKDFFSSELQSEIAANLGKALLLKTSTNALRPSPEASAGFEGPVELLESNSDTENESNFDPTSDDDDNTETVSEASSPAEESNSESIN
jgi:hypothetical protein